VIDCWRVLDGKDLSGIIYFPLGKGMQAGLSD